MACNPDNEEEGKKFQEESAKQKNENLDELLENKVIKEINDDIIAGFASPEILQNDLKEPGYEKYFLIPQCQMADEVENEYL